MMMSTLKVEIDGGYEKEGGLTLLVSSDDTINFITHRMKKEERFVFNKDDLYKQLERAGNETDSGLILAVIQRVISEWFSNEKKAYDYVKELEHAHDKLNE